MAQPQPPTTRQSGPEAKKAHPDVLHTLAPGGPIMPVAQPDGKPNPTDRGKEHNTSYHKGEPNPEQNGSPGHIGGADHNPGYNNDTHRPNVPVVLAAASEKHSAKGTKVAPPMPNEKGVRK